MTKIIRVCAEHDIYVLVEFHQVPLAPPPVVMVLLRVFHTHRHSP